MEEDDKRTLEYQLLREENERLAAVVSDLRDRNRALTLALNSMKYARKMEHLLRDDEDDDESKARYRMDEHGNLTRIE